MTGAAWLSSARVVRCWVKSRNERNPCPYLPAHYGGNSKETAGDKPEEGGTTSSHHGPYGVGYKRATMVGTKGCKPAMVRESQKTDRSPDWGLQLDPMNSESLVIANQNVAVNTFPGLVHTARHTMEVGCTRSR